MENCPFCGAKLIRTRNYTLICPNCGIIENKDFSDTKDDVEYIG